MKSTHIACKATIPELRMLGRRAEALADPATEDARNVHQFLASTDLLSGIVYGRDVHQGRALIEWFADQLDEESCPGPAISLADVGCVLDYLSSIHSINPQDCFGHSGGPAACGYMNVLHWLIAQIQRLAAEGGAA